MMPPAPARRELLRTPCLRTSENTPSRNCLVNGETLLKRCILAMTRSTKWARTALSGTCRAFFGAYRGFAKQSLEGKFSEVHLTHILGPAEVGCWVADKIGGDHGLRERGR